jgi:ABC-type uncharacterized transport system substrate-binding protein
MLPEPSKSKTYPQRWDLSWVCRYSLFCLFISLSVSAESPKHFETESLIYFAAPREPRFEIQMQRLTERIKKKAVRKFKMEFIELPKYTHEVKDGKLVALVKALAQQRPLAILTPSMDIAIIAVEQKVDVQVVVSGLADPVAIGISNGASNPDSDITGYSYHVELDEKRLAILKEVSPASKRIGILLDSVIKSMRMANNGGRLQYIVEDAVALPFEANSTEEAVSLVQRSKQLGVDSWYIPLMPLNYEAKNAKQIIDAVNTQKLPAIYERMKFVEAGGLVAYEQVFKGGEEIWIRDILLLLQGVRARNIPFERPRHFFMSINLEQMKKLRLAPSPSLIKKVDITFPCRVKHPLSCTTPMPME